MPCLSHFAPSATTSYRRRKKVLVSRPAGPSAPGFGAGAVRNTISSRLSPGLTDSGNTIFNLHLCFAPGLRLKFFIFSFSQVSFSKAHNHWSYSVDNEIFFGSGITVFQALGHAV